MAAAFEVYEDDGGEYWWRLQSGNNRIIADPAEGYATPAGAKEGIADVKRIAPAASTTSRKRARSICSSHAVASL